MNVSNIVKVFCLALALSSCKKISSKSLGRELLNLENGFVKDEDDQFSRVNANWDQDEGFVIGDLDNKYEDPKVSASSESSLMDEFVFEETVIDESVNEDFGSEGSVAESSSSQESLSVFSAAEGQRWVGYWGAAMNGVGSGNYIAETASVSNIVFIRDQSPEESIAKLQMAKSYGLKAVLMVENVFFPWASSVLYSDCESRFDTYWQTLKDYHDIIAGFYIFDEPFWKNTTPGWTVVPNATLKDYLTKVNDLLHTKAPGRFTSIAYSTIELDVANFSSLFLPDNLDMWGVNCYIALGCSDEQLVGYWNKMLQSLKPNQHLLVTLDSYWSSAPTAEVQAQLTSRLRQWKSLIAPNQDKVLGFFPFLYQNHLSESLYGAESMSATRAEYSIYMEALLGRVTCSVNDLVRIDSNSQVIDRWANAPMCVPQCESQANYVRRDVLGNVIDVWWNAPAPYCTRR